MCYYIFQVKARHSCTADDSIAIQDHGTCVDSGILRLRLEYDVFNLNSYSFYLVFCCVVLKMFSKHVSDGVTITHAEAILILGTFRTSIIVNN